jgi:hypothetical protein
MGHRARRLGTLVCVLGLAGCGGSAAPGTADPALRALEREARPIGAGARFHPRAPTRVRGRCEPTLGARFPVHLELFAANRVVIVPAGIGVAGPRRRVAGRINGARCFGDLVTLDPTGVVLVRPGRRTLASMFRQWGEPLSTRALAGFAAPTGTAVRVYVDGRPRRGPLRAIRLTPDAEIVLELGPYVPPHARYAFAPLHPATATAGRTTAAERSPRRRGPRRG